MSATARTDGVERADLDFYETPKWAADAGAAVLAGALLERASAGLAPIVHVRDPAVGTGALLAAVARLDAAAAGESWSLSGIDLDASRVTAAIARMGPGAQLWWGSFFDAERPPPPGPFVDIVNPPYTEAEAFVRQSFADGAAEAIYLLRMGFLATDVRTAFWAEFVADVGLLVTRPSFTVDKNGRKGTDACEYGWFRFRRRTSADEPACVLRRLEGFRPPKREPKPKRRRRKEAPPCDASEP